MKPSLQLRVGQSLSMTPQLQQAIRLLQLSSLELQAEIQEALETNPLLEVEEEFNSDDVSASDQDNSSDTEIDLSSKELNQVENSSIPDELPTDSEWEDTFDTQVPNQSSNQIVDSGIERDNEDNSGDTLQEH